MQLQHPDFVIGTGSLNLTLEEKRVFGQLFRQADREGLGVVTGEVAVKFFEQTRLEPRILGKVSTLGRCPAEFWLPTAEATRKSPMLINDHFRSGRLPTRKIEGCSHQPGLVLC
jgi:hypothetical protein